MTNSSLLLILRSFSPEEMKEFELFVSSPFFNKNKNVITLFSLLKKHYPALSSKNISKEKLSAEIFTGDVYSDENMKTLIYLLTRLAEKFMAYTRYRADPMNERKFLLESLDHRNLDGIFIKHERKTGSLTSSNEKIELGLLKNKIIYNTILRDYYIKRGNEKKYLEHETKISECAITAFFMELFRLNTSFERIRFIEIDAGHDFNTDTINNINFENLLNSFSEHSFKNLPVIKLYYLVYKVISEHNDDSFHKKFIESFGEHSQMLTKTESYMLATLFVNGVHYKWERDNFRYSKDYLEAYKMLLSLYDYSGDVYLRPGVFRNALRIGLNLKEFSWIESFLKEYTPKLDPAYSENMTHYANAYLSFAKNEFGKSLEHSSKVNLNTFQMKYHMRNLQLSALYELEEYESALNLIDSYKHFIREEKNFSKELKKRYMKYIAFTNELISARLSGKKPDIDAFKQEIIDSKTMRIEWLLNKAEELKDVK